MSLTTLQKVTLISCSVLCVSLFLPKLLLPRGKKDVGQPDVRPGFYPPMMHRLPVPEDQAPWEEEPQDLRTHSAEVMAKVKGMSGASRTSLLGQVIPIYGFGILLYILFIFYKMTSKGKPAKQEGDFASIPTDNMRNTISDYELARLQRRLEQTEKMMETMVFGTGRAPDSARRTKYRAKSKRKAKGKGRSKGITRQQLLQQLEEEELLRQLEEISRAMEEGCKEGCSPEMEAEEVPYTVDWEGYPAETFPQYAEPCSKRRYDTVILEEPSPHLPTAEALAERMEVEEGEVEEELRLPVLVEELEEEEEEELQQQRERQPCLTVVQVKKELLDSPRVRKRISFNDQEDVFHYPKESPCEEEEGQTEDEEEDEEGVEEEEEEEEEEGVEEEEEEEEEEDEEEEDPLMEAESLRLDCEVCYSPEAEAEQELEDEEEEEEEQLLLCVPQGGGRLTRADLAKELGTSGLRMRTRRET